MWSDEPNQGQHADGVSSTVKSNAALSHPDNFIPQPLNNHSSLLNPPNTPPAPNSPLSPLASSSSSSSHPSIRPSASVPSFIAHAKTSPVLRSQSRPPDDDDEDFPPSSSSSDPSNPNGLLTLPAPLASTQTLFSSPVGPRGAIIPPTLLRTPSVAIPRDEPLTYNRVAIQYAQHTPSKEMTDTANLIRQALQLRRHFVYRRTDRDTAEVDVKVDPLFKHPGEDVPPATQHGYMMVEGVYTAWEGEQEQPPEVTQFFSTPLSSPLQSAPEALKKQQPQSTQPQASSAASASSSASPAFFSCPSRSDYALALSLLMDIASSGPLRSFSHNRLGLLEMRFSLHATLNGELEAVAQRAVPHRDFYNVRKTDNHVHHSSCMNQKHLLRFIKHKLKQDTGEGVIIRDGRLLSLKQVFDSLNLTPYDLSVDTLDVHANYSTFHRFDRFNLKYAPIGESRLREIFLKYNNHIQGKFLAELTQQVFDDLESNKYQFAEYRLSIYGSAGNEWDVLADWVCSNRLFHYNVRWMIQIPRLYAVYRATGKVQHFGEMLRNVFGPLFEVTVNPSSHPSLHRFLQQCVGFDIVDDESVREKPFTDHLPLPDQFDGPIDPPYAYFAYYTYANLNVLNQLRASKGFTTFAFRPHAGEAGDAEHLACTFLLAQSINHGIQLSKSPSLQYLYYLAQVGISMSPLCNNLLFLTYDKSPFPRFFQRGLNVTLSTDDPLMVHVTKEPLVEEYSVAAQVWKLTSVDLSEIARNSVLQSGWEHRYKLHFLGNRYWVRGLLGNDIRQTNLPAIRVQYRAELLQEELHILSQHADEPLDESLVDPL